MARQRMRRKVRKFAKAALSAANGPEARAAARAMLRCNTLEEAQALTAPAPEPVEAKPKPKAKAKPKAKSVVSKVKKALSKDK